MAKPPPKKSNNASKRTANSHRPTARGSRPPVRGGRPAGLFTWLAVGLVVAIVAGLVIIKVTTGGTTVNGATTFQPTDPTTLAELTQVPASVFNAVGISSGVAQVTPPEVLRGQPPLTGTNAQGKKLPEVLYIGAEYCPYCAAQRWATIVALSRFGKWSNLGNMSSYSQDIYPNTPTFTFVRAKYNSPYLVFKGVEEFHNYLNAAGTNYALLQQPTAQENAVLKKYDTPKYINGLTLSQKDSIPFLSFGNKFLVAGASYSPSTLSGSSRSAIAAALSNPTSPITQAIIASANFQTAALCTLTGQKPTTVCTSSAVKKAAALMKIK